MSKLPRIKMRFSAGIYILITAVAIEIPSVVSRDCTLPEQPVGGSYGISFSGVGYDSPDSRHGSAYYGSLFFTCNEGYTRIGKSLIDCVMGRWETLPKCVKNCPALQSDEANMMVCSRNGETVSCLSNILPDTIATLSCKHPYQLPLADHRGYTEFTCNEEGNWHPFPFRCTIECGITRARANPLLINGFRAEPGTSPWHVAIYQKNSTGRYDQICAGSLISSNIVISAAHCFYDEIDKKELDASSFAVAAGKFYRAYTQSEMYAQKSMVQTIHLATRYLGADAFFAEDIAWLVLRNPFRLTPVVRPVCMDLLNQHESEELRIGQVGKVVGWGKKTNGDPNIELQETNLPFVPYEECVSAVPEDFRAYITSDKFCAGYLNGTSVSDGDSGGGLSFQRDGRWYLRGIVSVSPIIGNTSTNNYYTAFTNVGGFINEMYRLTNLTYI